MLTSSSLSLSLLLLSLLLLHYYYHYYHYYYHYHYHYHYHYQALAVNEIVEIPEDHVQVLIFSADCLQAVLGTNSSKSISIRYNLGFPRDDVLIGKTEPFNHDKDKGCLHYMHMHLNIHILLYIYLDT